MKILDADIRELRRASGGGRVRSPETQQLIAAIESLGAGRAKAVIPEDGETVARLRSRLSYAARIADAKLKIVALDNRLLFALRPGSSAKKTIVGKTERRAAVREAALKLGQSGRLQVKAEDILRVLGEGAFAGVARPATVVGAVLRAMPEFERVGKNEFMYKS